MDARLGDARAELRDRPSDADFRQHSVAVPELRGRPSPDPDAGLSHEAELDVHGALPQWLLMAIRALAADGEEFDPSGISEADAIECHLDVSSYMGFSLAIGNDSSRLKEDRFAESRPSRPACAAGHKIGKSIMIIRQEKERDYEAISQVTAAAFASMEHSSGMEVAIIRALRDAGALTISLVAADGDAIIGHIAFSPVTINGEDGSWFGLGPVSVQPDLQGRGVGDALIRQGLHELRKQGAAGCVVLGDPAFYRRFGFENDPDLKYTQAPPEYFMQVTFNGSVPAGQVEYHGAFGAIE